MNNPPDWSAKLAEILAQFHCVTGTLHRTDPETGLLQMLAQQGIPPFLLDKIATIPFGKGIAGCAAEQQSPVQMCNLQKDTSGVARPDAVETKVAGALAVPIFGPTGEKRVIGVLGIGKHEPYEFTETESEALAKIAAEIAPHLQ